jgi:hypothetical protein
MLPPPPDRFSMMKGWPSRSDSYRPIGRAVCRKLIRFIINAIKNGITKPPRSRTNLPRQNQEVGARPSCARTCLPPIIFSERFLTGNLAGHARLVVARAPMGNDERRTDAHCQPKRRLTHPGAYLVRGSTNTKLPQCKKSLNESGGAQNHHE